MKLEHILQFLTEGGEVLLETRETRYRVILEELHKNDPPLKDITLIIRFQPDKPGTINQ